ncbi:hypothetical protein SCLCIDRAFT_1191561 [Scleroderma citrinum Foug A]|uniref:DUF7928 domain-containing protein n=1 Tax=Scleroderma citrinum Foug A TaxID=1036808 RepID=A0A0C3DQ04_9AGAM|nr:hypothetical protein SCLCIDRAFT_1191561 [Scleroderma citrinum Foug A]
MRKPSLLACLRMHDSTCHVFPYKVAGLEPFKLAIAALNPFITVKICSAAVHAALTECPSNKKTDCIYVDTDTCIQVLDTMVLLPQAEKEQSAAFIVSTCSSCPHGGQIHVAIASDFEDHLICLLWRNRPPHSPLPLCPRLCLPPCQNRCPHSHAHLVGSVPLSEKASPEVSYKRTWFGHKIPISIQDEEKAIKAAPRPTMLFAPAYKLQWPGLAVIFMGNATKIVSQEWRLDRNYTHFALLALVPFLLSVSLFFTLQLFQNVSMAIGPIAQYFRNSCYYSIIPPQPNKEIDAALPHITIQMPVYKESLNNVLCLSFESLKKAMQTYACQGGTSSIFVNDDGL